MLMNKVGGRCVALVCAALILLASCGGSGDQQSSQTTRATTTTTSGGSPASKNPAPSQPDTTSESHPGAAEAGCRPTWVASVYSGTVSTEQHVAVESGEFVDSGAEYPLPGDDEFQTREYVGSSADGCTVLLTSEIHNAQTALAVDVGSGTTYELYSFLNRGVASGPMVSPDGRWVAWTTDETIDGTHNETPWILDFRDGSEATPIPGKFSGNAVLAGFTPESTLLVGEFFEGYLEYDPATDELEPSLAKDPGPWARWYFPAEKIWVRDKGDDHNLRLETFNQDGDIRELFTAGTADAQSRFVQPFPAAGVLVISGENDSQICSVDEGGCTQVAPDLRGVLCTAMSDLLLVCGGQSGDQDRAFVFDLESSTERPLNDDLTGDVHLAGVGPELNLRQSADVGD